MTQDSAFSLDMRTILTQYCLGGNAVAEHGFFFNSALENYAISATPSDPKGTTFHLDFGKRVQYEVCYMPDPRSSPLSADIGKTYEEAVAEIEAASSSLDEASKKKRELNSQITGLIQQQEAKYRDEEAYPMLKTYLANFAGSSNSEDLEKTDIMVVYLPEKYWDGPEGIKGYKNFKIDTVDSDEDKLELAKQRYQEWRDAGDKKQVALRGLAFKLAYTVTV